MGRLSKSLIGLSVAALVASCIPVSRMSYTCLLCRLVRVETTYGPFPFSIYRPNECSRWYPTHIEARHDHLWERGTCRPFSNLLGFPGGFACSPGRYPIWMLSPEAQLAAYQHLDDPEEAKALFAGLADAKTQNDRLDEGDETKGVLIVLAISEWESAGFPDTWEKWWGRWWDRHVEERRKWRQRNDL